MSVIDLLCWMSVIDLLCWMSVIDLLCWISVIDLLCWMSVIDLLCWMSVIDLLCWMSVIDLLLIVNCSLSSIKCAKVLFMQLHICLVHIEYKNFHDLHNLIFLCHKNLNMGICRKLNKNENVLQLGTDM